MGNIVDVVEMLRKGISVEIMPKGNSMLPLIYPGRDKVLISPVQGKLKKYDIVLYRSNETGLLTLHRIVDINNENYFVSGDNQFRLEKIHEEQIHGVVTEIIRNGKKIRTDNKLYLLTSAFYTNNKKNISRVRRLIKN